MVIWFVLQRSRWLRLEIRRKGSRAETETSEEAVSFRQETWWSGPEAIVRKNRMQRRGKKETGRDRDPEMERERIRHRKTENKTKQKTATKKREPETQGLLRAVMERNTDISNPMTPNTFPTPTHAWRLDRKRR